MAKTKTKTGASPGAPVVAGPVVPLVSAGRLGVDPSLSGKDRRRAEEAATAPVKPKRARALREQLDALVADAAGVGLHLEVDRDAFTALTAQQPSPAPAEPPAGTPVEAPAEPAAPRATRTTAARPAKRTPPAVRRAIRPTPEPAPAPRTPRRRSTTTTTPAARTTPVRTPARTPARGSRGTGQAPT